MNNLPYPMPQVHLPRDGGCFLNLADLRPAKVLLFFYPRDNTSSCIIEAKTFTSFLSQFEALNTRVIGISKDTIKSHDKFVSKHKLKVPLLSDKNNNVCESFNVLKEKSIYGKTYFGIERSTFLIDSDGQVVREWRKVKVSGHVEAVLAALKELS